MKPRYVLLALAAVASLAGCGGPNNPDDARTGTSPAAADAPTRADASPTAIGAPALPGSLPTFTTEDKAEQAMRDLITLAANHAENLSSNDRHPEVVTTTDFACGVKVAADTCSPTSPDQKVVIYINPDVAWNHYEQETGHGGGDTPWQNAVLAAYMNHVIFRQIQATEPSLLTDQSDTAIAEFMKIQHCKEGSIAGPLEKIMSSELLAMYTPLHKYPDYVDGINGKC
jgi:predicted small lipoprotein YifL